MTEDEARRWLTDVLHLSPDAMARLELYVALLLEESTQQNLIAASTVDHVWARHIVDSAQLLRFAPEASSGGVWLDMGSGAGLPAIVIAAISDWKMVMVESRARRTAFLQAVVDRLGIAERVTILSSRLELVESFPAAVISARAFAPLDKLLALSARFSTANTLWLLPKGRNAAREYEAVRKEWRLMFHVEQSLTDAEAGILVGHVEGRRR